MHDGGRKVSVSLPYIDKERKIVMEKHNTEEEGPFVSTFLEFNFRRKSPNKKSVLGKLDESLSLYLGVISVVRQSSPFSTGSRAGEALREGDGMLR